jgi:hypothetical protein
MTGIMCMKETVGFTENIMKIMLIIANHDVALK